MPCFSPAAVTRACLGALAIAMAPGVAHGASDAWQPVLEQADTRLERGDERLGIVLPADMPPESLAWLALELDGVDVSEIVQLEQRGEAQVVSVVPPQALGPGQHELRLVEYTPAGDIIERGVWYLSVGDAVAERKAAQRFFAAEFVLEGSYRVADNEFTDVGDPSHGQGAARLQAGSRGGAVESEAYVALLYDSLGADLGPLGVPETAVETDPTIVGLPTVVEPRRGRELELGEYRLSARTDNVSAVLGHHAPAAESLLIQDFHRRGVSVTAQSDNERVVGSGFVYRTEPVNGFRFGAGVGNHEHRVAGSLLSLSPLPANPDALTVTATYVNGEGEDHSGLGIAGNDIEPEGDGYAVAIESRLVDRRLQLRAEHAETRYDFDGTLGGFEEADDDAQSFLGLFHIWQGRDVGGRQANWNVGYEKKKIGLFFRSLANPSLPFDRNLERLFTVLQVGGFSLQLQLARETDNVARDDTLPTLTNELASFALSWTPYPEVDEAGNVATPWYGLPTLSFVAQYSDQVHDDLPAVLAASGADRQVATYQGGVSFQYDSFYWGVNHAYSVEKDFGFFFADNRHRLTDLSLQWQPAARFSLGAQLQYNTVRDLAGGGVSRSYLAGLDARHVAFDERLTTTVSYSVNQNGARDDSIDARFETTGIRLDWLLRPARENRPGWTLWLQGERQEFEDGLDPRFDQDPYQVFVGTRMDWSIGRSSQ